MRRIAKTLGLISAIAVTAAGTGLVIADEREPSATSSGLKANDLAGKWVGEWNNKTFGSSGAVRGNVKTKGKDLVVVWDFDGNVFGCSDPDKNKTVLDKGKGKNAYNGKKLKAVDKSDAFGKLVFKYTDKNGKVSGGGASDKGCSAGISYEFGGKLKNDKKLSLDTDIAADGEDLADSTVDVKKKG